MGDRTLVTGFLPFGDFTVNPSALLAALLGRRFEVIEVSYAAADEFIDRIASAPDTPDSLVMIGLRGSGTRIDLEHVARNHVGPAPDVRGVVRGPGPVEPGGPETLPTTLFGAAPIPPCSPSTDAGCYLCNYLYYRALRRLPAMRVGFVHVPPPEVMPLDVQRRELDRLIGVLESPASRL